ncbi:ATPase [Actinokineospora fastidiosa]|uniref:histidine kinase n=2 Tax=Actinokineospora fastidiosa TaxID=1816 RepID=A0A918GGK5_9PSEU|nr:ATPase [Actinokineospora fastidiosa]
MPLVSGEMVRVAGRLVVGVAVGGVSAVGEVVFLILALLGMAVGGRPWVYGVARGLAEFERGRILRFFGQAFTGEFSGERALRYLGVRWLVGGLGLGVLLLMLFGAVNAVLMLVQLARGGSIIEFDAPEGVSWYDPVTYVLFGGLLAFVTIQGMLGVVELDRRLARHFLGPTVQERLQRRVSELTVSRAEVVEAIDAERRRIERDLHDGVQQRIVALGMLLGRARRTDDSGRAAELVRQAHDEAGRALTDLREVTWRVYPIALDTDGLRVALESLAEMAVIPVHLRYTLTERYPSAVEVPAYFVASEAVTNAVKHSGASRIDLAVERVGSAIVVRVTDDGVGGADPRGGGLSGLARRVAAVDGVFTVDSPPAGPTVITARLPCA